MDGSEQGQPAGPSRPWQKRSWQVLAIVAAALVLLGSGLAVGSHLTGLDRLPDVHALAADPSPSDTLVYDRTGTVLLADLHTGGYRRYQVPLTAMGRWLPAATDADAGSSLTQRLVRLRLGIGGPTTAGKLRQATLTLQANTIYSHSQILELYLNSAFYGNSAYGAAAAARIYFNTDASKLDLAQAALLAGLPQKPTDLDPLRNWSAAKHRQRGVLDAMVRSHSITVGQADEAYAESLQVGSAPTVVLAPGFVSQVVTELTERFGKDAPQRGLQVVSSLDLPLQQQAEQAMQDAVRANSWRGVSSGALVAMDPRTGEVLAMVGSVDPNAPGGQLNMAVWPPRSPGSASQLFTYTAAIASKRYTMVTPIADGPIAVDSRDGPPYMPQNADRAFHGTCELRACLGGTLSVPAVEVELATGLPQVVGTARAMGAPPLRPHFAASGSIKYTGDDSPDSFGPSLTLGGYGQTPLQMATGMSVLASGGVRRQPAALRSVSAPDGTLIFKAKPARGSQAVDAGAAFVVSQMLSDDDNRAFFGRGTPLVLPGRHAAALTGTPDDLTDAWALGYTPSLAAAVWMGNTDFRPMVPGSDAKFVAAPAWHRFMQSALDQMQKGDEWYTPPAGVESTTVSGRQAWFLPGTTAATPAPSLPPSVHFGSG
jgi:membrane peptidoglycan carboxypeptidase